MTCTVHIAHETSPLQYTSRDCHVQCAIGRRNRETTVALCTHTSVYMSGSVGSVLGREVSFIWGVLVAMFHCVPSPSLSSLECHWESEGSRKVGWCY